MGRELNSRMEVERMNLPELRAAVARADVSNRAIAAYLELSEQALYNKMSGKTEFKNSEIVKLAEILGLSMSDVNLIFFSGSVN